jgi:hypothetical protein
MTTTAIPWAHEELAHADLGHAARTTRAVARLDVLVRRPAGTVTDAFQIPCARKAAYRFLENDAIGWDAVADAQHVACARRCRDEDVVLAALDGSSLAHTDTSHDDGVGPIGTRTAGGRGLKTMTLLVMTRHGIELGVGAHVFWARAEQPDPTPSGKRALADKESRHWTALQHAFERTLRQEGVTARVWYQMDREGDTNPVLLRGLEPDQLFTVRRDHNRNLAAWAIFAPDHPELKLEEQLAALPVQGLTSVQVPAGHGRPARRACLEVRYVGVSFRLRAQWTKRHLGDVPRTVVWVREVGTCPPGADPLDGSLITSYPVTDVADACEVVRNYALRWRLETVHFTWKSGACHVEDAQLESFQALAKWATLHLSVAIELQALLHRARTEPTLPADVVFARDEIDATRLLYRDHRATAADLGATPTLGEIVGYIAELGGYIGKSSGGPPGVKVLQRGLSRVVPVARALHLLRARAAGTTPPDRSG